MADQQTTDALLDVDVDMELCDGHGQCEFAAPTVFRIDDEGELQYEPHPAAELRAKVEQAIRVCPVQAIRLRG